nr:hypothetical protein [Entomohabitans teleogrylli]
MGMETIIGLLFTVVAFIAAVFGVGFSRGVGRSESRRMEETAAATKEAARRRAEAMKGANDVRKETNTLPGDAVDRELLERWTRKG